MRKFAFISRHVPTMEQHRLAEEQGIKLYHVGDMDAFSISYEKVEEAFKRGGNPTVGGPDNFEGVVVVHAAAAMRLMDDFAIGVFENEMRAAEGERPTFHAKALHIY